MKKTDIVSAFEKTGSIKASARETGIGYQIVRRVLITEGILPSERAALVDHLSNSGKTEKEIAANLGISEKAVRNFMPYKRKSYIVGEKTKNALKIKKAEKKRRKNHEALQVLR